MPSGWDSIQEPNRAIGSYIGISETSSPTEEGMDESLWWLIDIVGPAILLIILIWLVMRRRSNQTSANTEASTRELYREEEQRRRDGTDQL